MEQEHKKFVNISYIAFSALIAFIVFATLMKLSGMFDWESKVKSIEYVIRGTSIVVGFGLYGYLFRSAVVNAFMSDVAIEFLNKVTWPTSKDTFAATGVVIVAVLIASLVLGFFDWIWALAVKGIL